MHGSLVGSPRHSGHFRSITTFDTARFAYPSCILPLDKTYLQPLRFAPGVLRDVRPRGCCAIMVLLGPASPALPPAAVPFRCASQSHTLGPHLKVELR
jgi:hypothetical protein